jgi:hypothetical protein
MSYTAADVQVLLSNIQESQHDVGYQIQLLNNYQQLSDAVQKQNNMIYSTYYDKITFNSADSQQSKYVFQSSLILKNLYTYGFWIYITLAILLCALIWRNEMNVWYKVILVATILLYPYYIYPLEELSYRISSYLWALLLSVSYDNGYGNMSMEHGLSLSAGEAASVAGGSSVGIKGKSSAGGYSSIGESSEDSPDEPGLATENKGNIKNKKIPPLYVPPTLPPPPTRKPITKLQFSEVEDTPVEKETSAPSSTPSITPEVGDINEEVEDLEPLQFGTP